MHRASLNVLSGLFALAACSAPSSERGGPASPSRLSGDPLILARSAVGEARPLAVDLLLGRPGAAAAIQQWLAAKPSADAGTRAGVWLLLCEERFRRTEYASAIQACDSAERAQPGAAAGFLGLIRPLAEVPQMRWDVPSLSVPLTKDSDGTRRIRIDHPSGAIEAVIDSGAEVAVVMESVARRLGARPLGASSIGTTTAPVQGNLAVIDRLSIGSGHLMNLPVAVLPDDQLSFPDGTSLPIILPLWALTSAGKAAFLQYGAILALGDAVPDADAESVSLYWDPSGIGFEARFAGGPRAVHLDTGSRRNYLFPTALRSLSSTERASRQPFERRLAGIGGERIEQAFRFPSITLHVGGLPWVFAPMEMAPEDQEGESARIGAPIMDRFETIILDFERMRMFVR